MDKSQPQKPLMLAYILFLCVCLIANIFSGVLNFDFSAWSKIVVAATIASFFFSGSTIPKMNAKMTRNACNSAMEQHEIYTQICKQKEKLCSITYEGKKVYECAEETMNEVAEKIKYGKDAIVAAEKRAFQWDVLGFLVFFCILTFDGLYAYFEKSQDVYTLLAFIAVLAVDYIESTFIKKYEDRAAESVKVLNEFLTLLEGIEDGQT